MLNYVQFFNFHRNSFSEDQSIQSISSVVCLCKKNHLTYPLYHGAGFFFYKLWKYFLLPLDGVVKVYRLGFAGPADVCAVTTTV